MNLDVVKTRIVT